ncbi:fused MFS/spermidine synthase, partial [Candidatus Sumerlaeota bacterium]|nr:fused MFS/spermidine synthase [Candidatus Sumerlaeota bacterium]
ADRLPEPVRCFSLIQLGIGLTGAVSLIVIQKISPGLVVFKELSDDQTEIYFAAAVANIFIKTGAAIFLPTFLMGMAYPVAARICVSSLARVGRTVGDLYSINTVGAIIGALAAGFVLIPAVHIPWTIFLLSLGNFAMAVVITTNLTTLDPRRRYFVIGLAAICGIVLLIRFPFEAILHRINFEEVRAVQYKEGALATVSAVENPLREWTLYIDSVGVAGTDRVLLTDQKSLAHIPMLFLDKPATALTVGFGCGGASYSYLRYSALQKLDCVEICPTVLEFAPLFSVANKGQVLRRSPDGRIGPLDPRYSLIIDDIRSYLRFNPKRYDIIASDCTDLRYKTNANLYDLGYFQLCRDRLTSGGMLVVWMPLGGLSTDTLRIALRTFQKVFPDFSLWYMNNEATHYALLIGALKPLQINYRRIGEKLKEKSVNDDLAELCLNDADKLLSCYVTDGRVLEKELEGALVNSENRPYLEFLVPRYGYSEEPLYSNLDWLFAMAGSIEPYLEPGSYSPDDLARIRKYRSAVRWIVEGHKAYRRVKPDQAVRSYLRALETCPEDRATSRLLDFPSIQAREQLLPNDFWAPYWLGQVLSVQKDRDAEAISHLEEALRVAINRRDNLAQQGAAGAAHDAARLLRQIYERKSMKRELEQLAKLEKDLPTTASAQTTSP